LHLRPTAEQSSLRADAADFCAGLRPLLESDPEWWRQGMLSDGDSVAVNRALGEYKVPRTDNPLGINVAHVVARATALAGRNG